MSVDYDMRILSLGAGVQSTALYLMALADEFEDPPTVAIFADTQWEPQVVYDHLDELERLGGEKIPIHRVTHGNLKEDVMDAVGPPGRKIGHIGQPPFFVRETDEDAMAAGRQPDRGGMLWRKCTTDYKLAPLRKEVRRLVGIKPRQRKIEVRVQQWIGISIDEASRMKDSGVPWSDNYYPLIEHRLSRADCLKWLKAHGYPEPRKSACTCCPYHSKSHWVDMKKHHPQEWDDSVAFDAHLRTGKLPGVTGDAYVHRRMVPLEEAILSDHDPDQIDMFEQECEGMCGV